MARFLGYLGAESGWVETKLWTAVTEGSMLAWSGCVVAVRPGAGSCHAEILFCISGRTCNLFCEFAPLTCHVSMGSLRYRIECILSETLVFMGTSKEAFSILFYIHFGQVACLEWSTAPAEPEIAARAVSPQAYPSTMRKERKIGIFLRI